VLRVATTVALGVHLAPAPWPRGAIVERVELGSPAAEAEYVEVEARPPSKEWYQPPSACVVWCFLVHDIRYFWIARPTAFVPATRPQRSYSVINK
jgi:hypothetical protein